MKTSNPHSRFVVSALLAGCAGLALTAGSTAQNAELGSLTLVTWGGAYATTSENAFLKPFADATGATYTVVEAPGQFNARLQADSAAGNVAWDVADLAEPDALALAEQGLLEPLSDELKAELATLVGEDQFNDYGVSVAAYGSVIVCDMDAVQACPSNAAEFWDVENFPGRRTMYGDGWEYNTALALLADGVAKEDLFPLDLDRAYRKLDEIKPHVNVWWTSGDQAQQVLRDGEVEIGILFDGRAAKLKEQGVNTQLNYGDTLISRDLFALPKGGPNPEAAEAFLKFYAQNVEKNAEFIVAMRYGVATAASYALVDPEIIAGLASSPENAAQGVVFDGAWAATNRPAGLARWTEWLSR